MYKYLLILCLSVNVSFASAVKLVDYLITGSGVSEILVKNGITGNEAKQVQSYIASSLASLSNKKGKELTREELLAVISKLPVTGQDATARKSLQVLLDKPDAAIKKADVVEAINHIIYLANRHGNSVIITCAECVNEKLAKEGFKFTVETITNSSAQKLFKGTIPQNPADLNKFISARMKRLGMGDYSKVTPKAVLPEDEKTLALFLGLAESGSAEQKALIASIKKVSMGKDGKVNIIDPKSTHKFWKILADDMSADDMAGWTKTLDEVAARSKKDGVTAEEAFYRTLKDKAQGNEYLTKQYETLKAKKCFFK